MINKDHIIHELLLDRQVEYKILCNDNDKYRFY